ncbi:MAG: family 16 glycosylhydrolase [Dysgonamonadaceae bacterium]|jgi:beta-glucanase (GH16 family)|nr:family 16 glycosylhydrolase [Dysgonamonadaceae bacterium]
MNTNTTFLSILVTILLIPAWTINLAANVAPSSFDDIKKGSDFYIIYMDAQKESELGSKVREKTMLRDCDVWPNGETLKKGYRAVNDVNAWGVRTTWLAFDVAPNLAPQWKGGAIVAKINEFPDGIPDLSPITNNPNGYYFHFAIKSPASQPNAGWTLILYSDGTPLNNGGDSLKYYVGKQDDASLSGAIWLGDYAHNGEWQHFEIPVSELTAKKYKWNGRFVNARQYLLGFQASPDVPQGTELNLDAIFFYKKPNTNQLRMVWHDEFDGDTYDHTIWEPYVGGADENGLDGFGNNELQYYTDAEKNIFTRDGNLVLKVYWETYLNKDYTSGKLRTKGLKDFTYGRVEARFKLPKGFGTWPAIWMLPSQDVYGGWPHSGEIDIMEFVGHDSTVVHGTVHRGAGSAAFSHTRSVSIAGQTDDFHVVRIDWEPDFIRWYLNDNLFHTYSKESGGGTAQWPFDQDFHVILNFAVGGDWGGLEGVNNTIWPQEFLIDYVRVYQKMDATPIADVPDKPVSVFSRSQNEWTICSQSSKPLCADVYSLSGQKRLTHIVRGTQTVDVSSLSRGVYIIRIYDGEKAFAVKMIK